METFQDAFPSTLNSDDIEFTLHCNKIFLRNNIFLNSPGLDPSLVLSGPSMLGVAIKPYLPLWTHLEKGSCDLTHSLALTKEFGKLWFVGLL